MKQMKHGRINDLIIFFLVFSMILGSVSVGTVHVKAEEAAEETAGTEETGEKVETGGDTEDAATLRLLFTSDVHGQLTTEDYETGSGNYTSGGYSRTVTLLKEAKAEVDPDNSMLFDLGDNLYDYTTDFIYNYDTSAKQPIFAALAKVGYDALVLGNHEFDYTLTYLKDQLTAAGLSDQVILSNVKDAVTKEPVWAENKILTKTLKTSSGQQVSVKVGLIGETVPALSKKRTNYTGILETEDIVANVEKEVSILKEQGADLIVVLAHSGIGTENPELLDACTGYALTKIDGVDAVLCGHSHRFFPDTKTTIYDALPGVDLKTGLVNGKPLLQVENRGAGIGVADLKLAARDGKIEILDRKTEIRKVSEDTPVDQEINACFGDWAPRFMSDCSEILCDIDENTELQNYFGTMEDTDAMQLLNNIKTAYGLYYSRVKAVKYKSYPIVAASSYIKYGSEDDNDFVDISGQFKRSNIYNLIRYKTGLYLYQMTGAQIREWLEWTASCYEEPGINVLIDPEQTGDTEKKETIEEVLSYSYEKPLQYALKEDYLDNWSDFYVFDGIEYTIDTSVSPRYDTKGNQIRDTHRITSMTRNGVKVEDNFTYIVVTHRLPSNTLFASMNPTKITSISTEKYRTFIENYLKKISQAGNLEPIADHNWSLSFSGEYNYLLRSSKKAEKLMETRPWISEVLGTEGNRQYYLADFAKRTEEDTEGPNINVTALVENTTNLDVPVSVLATDVSGVASIKYAYGKHAKDSEVWAGEEAGEVANGESFACTANGTYSVLAADTKGNKRVTYIRVLNINRGVLAAPSVDTYSNRKTYITGTAEANATIYFTVESGMRYSTKVGSNGKFKYKLPSQRAGRSVYVYVVDQNGRTSARTVVVVKRTGPNKPDLDSVTTDSKVITGGLNDTYSYPVLLIGGKKIYVPNENVEALYKKSKFYNKNYTVSTLPMDIRSDGTFSITLPAYLEGGTSVKLKSVDVAYRCSLAVSVTCQWKTPHQPVSMSTVTNLSKSMKIYTDQKCSRAVVVIRNKSYSKSASSYNLKTKQYCYKVSFPRTDSTYVLRVYLENKRGKSRAVTIRPKEKAPDLPKVNVAKVGKLTITGKVDLVKVAGALLFSPFSMDNITIMAGAAGKTKAKTSAAKKKVPAIVSSTKTKVYVYVNGKKYNASITAQGKFTASLKKPLKKGDRIACKAKNAGGYSLVYRAVVK